MKFKKIAMILFALGFAVPAHAEDAQKAAPAVNAEQTLRNLIAILVQKGILTKDAADQLLQAAATPQAAPAQVQAQEPGVVRVPYVPEVVKEEIKNEVKDEVVAEAKGEGWGNAGSVPDWVNRISFDGDFRVRFQHNGFPSTNFPPTSYTTGGALISNTTVDHNYWLLAARLGVKAKISDNTFTALRITTGNTANPDSTNQTLGGGNGSYYALNQGVGTNGNFNKYSIVLDRAYIQSDPYYWLMLSAGKMPNPWLSTDMVFDTDINFEGFAASLKPQFSDTWSGFLTAGAFPVQDIVKSATVFANSKTLYAGQLGALWTAPNSSTAKFGFALYDFQNIEGTQNPGPGVTIYNGTAASTMQKGNTLMYVTSAADVAAGVQPIFYGLASKFREADLTGRIDIAAFDPTHVILTADYVKNLAFDRNFVLPRDICVAGPSLCATPGNTGYQVDLMVGVPEIHQFGEWQAEVAYKYIESDAVVDALNDQDFNLGGTNAKGYVIAGSYGLDKDTWLKLRWLSTDQISGLPLSIDVLQLDLNTRF